MQNEVRKDYLLDRFVIIASERGKRPTDFAVRPPEQEVEKTCPFCPGNERLTPPADLVYLPSNGGVIEERDSDGTRHKGWTVRCFPNLYPALSPEAKRLPSPVSPLHIRRDAYGFHEIIVESPSHDEHPGKARLSQLRLAFDAFLSLLNRFYGRERVRYVQIFRNHRKEAGASLSHAHTQMIAMPMIPSNVANEISCARRHHRTEGECVFCRIIAEEREGPRLIYEDGNFLVFAPWASVHPFEFWILPKLHQASLQEMTGLEKEGLAKVLRISLGGLARLMNAHPYNYGFHTAPRSVIVDEFYHWHLEVYPKLSTWAGFELGTGTYINVIPPEVAAKSLRESVKNEIKTLCL